MLLIILLLLFPALGPLLMLILPSDDNKPSDLESPIVQGGCLFVIVLFTICILMKSCK